MDERDDLELRVSAAVRAIAGRADVSADPVVVADEAADRPRPVAWRVPSPGWRSLPRLLAPVGWLVLLSLAAGTAYLAGSSGWLLPAPTASPSPSPSFLPAAAGVSGTQACRGSDGTTTGALTVEAFAAGTAVCLASADDPRVSGWSTFHATGPEAGGPVPTRPVWGDYRLEGPGGAWTGRFHAIPDAQGRLRVLVYASGTDAYAGWTYALAVGTTDDGGPSMAGAIYPGELPPGYPPMAGGASAAAASAAP